MRITVFILFVSAFQLVAMSSYSQTTTLSVKENGITLTDLFTQIEKQSEFLFFYLDADVKNIQANINVKEGKIEAVLEKALKGTDLTYIINDRNVNILKKSRLLPQQALRQLIGRVIDTNGEAVIGANVVEKGTTNGVVTDIDGNFTISVSENALLQVSYIGYITQEIAVGDKTSFDIMLREDMQTLDEVIVVGYGSQSKRKVTTAISSVDSEDLLRSSSTTTAGALSGKMAGVSTRAYDSRPGRGITVEVRNMGKPLYVIDGIPFGGDDSRDWLGVTRISGNDAFNALSLEDIESITILKDASASIYGLRAANGVVLVTTKKGRKDDKVSINVNGYYGWQNLTRFPKMANAAQYVRGRMEAIQNAGGDPSVDYPREEYAKWQAGTEPGYQSYDYYDLIMRKNVPQYHLNANVTGGSARTNYYMSLSRTDQEAQMKDFNYSRTNFQVNLSTNVFKGLTIGTQTSLKMDEIRDVGLSDADSYFGAMLAVMANRPTAGPYANGNTNYINNTPNRPDLNPALFNRETMGYKDTYTKAANVNLFAEYKFDFGLSAKYTYSHNYTDVFYDGFRYSYDLYSYDQNNDAYNKTGGLAAPWRFQNKLKSTSRYHNFQLSYANTFWEDHSISAVAGYERSDWDRDLTWLQGAPSNNYVPLITGTEVLTGYGDEWTYQARAGYIGRLNYSYKDKYLVELLARYDASYLYAPGKRWGFFPGVSLGWRMSDEKFFEKLKTVVSDLKIRASVGEAGQEEGVNAFGYLMGYDYGRFTNNALVGGTVLDGEYITGMQPKGLPVTNLSWVTHTTYNLGVDAKFFDNRLSITADVFRKVISGRPAGRYDVRLPSEVGYSLPNDNLTTDEYRGAEGMITYMDQIGELNYTVSANMTYSRYRDMERYKPRYGNSWDEYRSAPLDRWGGIWWGYQVIGRFQSEDEIRNYTVDNDGKNNRTQLPGDLIYKDVNGDGVINGMDERPIGYPDGWTPMLSFGGNIGLQWRDFDLNLDFSGGAMQSWNQHYELRNPFHANGNSPAYLLEDRWHRADIYDPNSEWIPGKYPAVRYNTSDNNGRTSDFWLHDVRYLRLKNAEFGYSLPKHLINKIYLTKARVYVSASNLFSIDNVGEYEIDPEIQASGAAVYPQQRTVMVGFNLTF